MERSYWMSDEGYKSGLRAEKRLQRLRLLQGDMGSEGDDLFTKMIVVCVMCAFATAMVFGAGWLMTQVGAAQAMGLGTATGNGYQVSAWGTVAAGLALILKICVFAVLVWWLRHALKKRHGAVRSEDTNAKLVTGAVTDQSA